MERADEALSVFCFITVFCYNLKMSIPIFLSSDNNYAPYMAAEIVSIVENTESFIDFYILDGGISDQNIEKISLMAEKYNNCSLEFIKIDLEKEFSSITFNNENCPHITISAYSRFLIPDLKPDLKKIIYLDIDIIANGDIKNLYEHDLSQYALGAVPGQMLSISQERIKTLNLSKSHKYFNSGVLLMDLDKFRNQEIIKHFYEIEQERNNDFKFPDQDIFNIYFDNNYLKLDKIYNYEARTIRICKDFVLRHYTSGTKPWQFRPDVRTHIHGIDLFWNYLKKTPFYDETVKNCKFTTDKSFMDYLFSKIPSSKS